MRGPGLPTWKRGTLSSERFGTWTRSCAHRLPRRICGGVGGAFPPLGQELSPEPPARRCELSLRAGYSGVCGVMAQTDEEDGGSESPKAKVDGRAGTRPALGLESMACPSSPRRFDLPIAGPTVTLRPAPLRGSCLGLLPRPPTRRQRSSSHSRREPLAASLGRGQGSMSADCFCGLRSRSPVGSQDGNLLGGTCNPGEGCPSCG